MTETTKEEPKTREEILRINYDARIQEVMHYQINIDNYTLALENIASLLPMNVQNYLALRISFVACLRQRGLSKRKPK